MVTAPACGDKDNEDPGAGPGTGDGGSDGGGSESGDDSATGASGDGSGGGSGESTSGNGDGDGDGDTAGGTFVIEPDVEGPATMCDLLTQDCPEGQKCTPASIDGDGVPESAVCNDIWDNPGQAGDDCSWKGNLFSGNDSCDVGTMCFPEGLEGAVPDGNGFCMNLCQGSPDSPTCADPDEICEVANDGALPWCLGTCDPLANECREGHGCYPAPDGRWACKITGMEGAYGDECGLGNSCNQGLLCVAAEAVPGCTGTGCCTEVCSLSSPSGDAQCSGEPQGQACQPAYTDMSQIPPGYEDVGICLIPQ